MDTPPPPPEAAAIRLARKAEGLSVAAAARAAGIRISTARWSQIENGYETRPGGRRAVRGRDQTIAHMARVVDVSPERLEECGRADAAAVLREIQRRQRMKVTPPPAPDPLTPEERRITEEFVRAIRAGDGRQQGDEEERADGTA